MFERRSGSDGGRSDGRGARQAVQHAEGALAGHRGLRRVEHHVGGEVVGAGAPQLLDEAGGVGFVANEAVLRDCWGKAIELVEECVHEEHGTDL